MTRPLSLLLASPDSAAPVLPRGLDASACAAIGRPDDRSWPDRDLGDRGGDPNDLRAQGWGIVIPQGEEGKRLLALIPGLRAAREQQQGAKARVYEIPPNLDAEAATAWYRQTILAEKIQEWERPAYRLLLGDLRQISPESQQVLALDGFPGRLCFDREEDYAAYEAKLLAAEATPLPPSPLCWYTVRDGTEATEDGYALFMKPGFDASLRAHMAGVLPASEVREGGARSVPDPAELMGAAADTHVLVTMCHGLGGPADSWTTPGGQRARQGTLAFGRTQTVEASDLAKAPFAPGGFWFHISCFGLGTPARSAYRHWLQRLYQISAFTGDAASVQASLPADASGAFISQVAQAALANQRGPLAMIGHMDLAWTFAFQDEQTSASRASRLLGVVRALAQGRRAGVAYRTLAEQFFAMNHAITVDYDRAEEAEVLGRPSPVDPQLRVNRWLTRQDLMGYALLGDPAARRTPGGGG